MTGEAVHRAPDERRFFAVATWTLPAVANLLPLAVVLGGFGARTWLGLLGLVVVIALVAVRWGRQVVGGLAIGALLGVVALMAALAGLAALAVSVGRP